MARSWGASRENPFTYFRVSTDDLTGQMRAYVGEGEFTADPLETFGGYGVVQVPRFQELLALYLRARLRASRLHQPDPGCAHPG